MNKLVVMCAVAIAAFGVYADATNLTPEERAAKRKAGMEKRLALSGGSVEKIVEGKSVQIVNAQSKAPQSSLDAVAGSIKQTLQLAVEVVPGVANKKYRPDDKAGVVISLVEDDGDSTLIVAPEQAWAVISITALTKDSPAENVLAERVQKEVWRALAIALGASNSSIQPCVMRQINSLADLDSTKSLVPCPEPFNAMISTSNKLGLGHVYRTSYRKACKEGWAPAPTNDNQRVIWEEYHSKPTEPIRIKFDPKKGM